MSHYALRRLAFDSGIYDFNYSLECSGFRYSLSFFHPVSLPPDDFVLFLFSAPQFVYFYSNYNGQCILSGTLFLL